MMREYDFEIFLRNEPAITSEKTIPIRMSTARKAEEILGQSFDTIVSDDDTMYESLIKLKPYENPAHAPLQNALRKYYKFINDKEFPRLRNYHSPKHP